MEPIISWDAPEHIYREKNTDWYWSVGIISITAIALAFILNNFMFGTLLFVSTFALIVHAAKRPTIVHYEINDRGIVAGDKLFPFLSLESFWIESNQVHPKMIIKSDRLFMPYIIIYIEQIDPETVREILLKYIAETEHHEPISHIFLERLGF